MIELVGGKSKLVHARPLPVDDPLQRRPDITLARDKLKWEPKVPLEQGLGQDHRVFRRPAEEQQGSRAASGVRQGSIAALGFRIHIRARLSDLYCARHGARQAR